MVLQGMQSCINARWSRLVDQQLPQGVHCLRVVRLLLRVEAVLRPLGQDAESLAKRDLLQHQEA